MAAERPGPHKHRDFTRSGRARAVGLLLAVSLLLLAGCGSSDEPVSVSGDGYTYTAPAGWEDLTGDAGKIADALGAAGAEKTAKDIGATYDSIVSDTEEIDSFRTNFNVITQKGLPSGVDSETLAKANASLFSDPAQAAQFLPDGFQINYDGAPPKKTTLGDEPAFALDYDATVNDSEIRATQLYVVRDGIAYIGTFTAPASAFEDQSGNLDAIVRSWRFK